MSDIRNRTLTPTLSLKGRGSLIAGGGLIPSPLWREGQGEGH
jgi:hypothetical protein